MEWMTAVSGRTASKGAGKHSLKALLPGAKWTNCMELVQQLIQLNAVAIKMQEYFHQTAVIEDSIGLVLVPVDEAVERLISAREASRTLGVELSIIACTESRRAVTIHRDRDFRDRKYLSGLISFGGLHAYCGGLDAAISRALIFAPHADVLCYKSATPDISEAKRFAATVRTACPEKRLAFGYSPKSDCVRWNETDHAAFESELYSAGFDHYFFTQFNCAVFPHLPSGDHWVMLDDAVKSVPSAGGNVALPKPLRPYMEQAHEIRQVNP